MTLPALRPAIVSAATVVFLFCATAFGVVLTLGGLRYSTVETEIYLLTTNLLDLQAAAALSVLQLLVIVVLLVLARRLRASKDPTVARLQARPHPVRRGDAGALVATALLLGFVLAPLLTLVSGSLRVGDTWSLDNYRALATTGRSPGGGGGARRSRHRRARQLAAHGLRRDLDGAVARPPGRGGRDPAVVLTPGSGGSGRAWTRSSCCRWGSRP